MSPLADVSSYQHSLAVLPPVVPVPLHKEFRCSYCNHLLVKGEIGPGTRLQFKCPRTGCKRTVTFAHM